MINEINLTDEQLAVAKSWASLIPETLNGSDRKGGGRLCGVSGEIAQMINLTATRVDQDSELKYDYDLIYQKDGLERTLDVKTEETSFKPKAQWDVSISAFNPNQKCDDYGFVRITKDYKTAYCFPPIPKDFFYKNAVFRRKGELDPKSGKSGFGPKYWYPEDQYVLEISKILQYNNSDSFGF